MHPDRSRVLKDLFTYKAYPIYIIKMGWISLPLKHKLCRLLDFFRPKERIAKHSNAYLEIDSSSIETGRKCNLVIP